MNGKIESFQSLGTLDGPGVRFVVFMQGCPLRCACCHNPETWNENGGTQYGAQEVFSKVSRYKNYFGDTGGITVSGGEPLLQAEFVKELFSLCKYNGITTALDTSGCIINETVRELLSLTDTVLLDYKMPTDALYQSYTGCEKQKVDAFLNYLQDTQKKVWIRQVVIQGITDTQEDILVLKNLRAAYSCIQKIELLPFHKMCLSKYESLGIEFRLKDIPETTEETIREMYQRIG